MKVLAGKLLLAERRAKREAIVAGILSAIAAVVGFALVLNGPPPGLTWLIALSIFGPVGVFLSLVWYGTYLERVDEGHYFPETAKSPGMAHAT